MTSIHTHGRLFRFKADAVYWLRENTSMSWDEVARRCGSTKGGARAAYYQRRKDIEEGKMYPSKGIIVGDDELRVVMEDIHVHQVIVNRIDELRDDVKNNRDHPDDAVIISVLSGVLNQYKGQS